MIEKFEHGFLNRVYGYQDYTQLEIDSKLIQKIDEVIELLKGIQCGYRGTSCPDQIARALEKVFRKKYKK